MHVILKQVGGTGSLLVRQGQKITVGRTEWADHSFPRDPTLEPVHFSVECVASGAMVLAAADVSVMLDGAETNAAALRDGQTIQAGNTVFQIEVNDPYNVSAVNDEDAADAMASSELADAETTASEEGWVSAPATLDVLSLDPIDDLCDVPPASATELARLLAAHDRHADAVQVLGFCMPRPLAVGWAADCVDGRLAGTLSDEERAAIAAAREWSADQTAVLSSAAGQAAEAVGLESAAGWVAQAAFWSGDNLSPPDVPAVKPPPTLTSAAVKGAIIAVAFAASPDAPDVVIEECLLSGYEAGGA